MEQSTAPIEITSGLLFFHLNLSVPQSRLAYPSPVFWHITHATHVHDVHLRIMRIERV